MTSKDMFKNMTYESLEKQVGGNHYSKMKIQPAQFINENGLQFAEGNAIKYICRHSAKGKRKDIEKAIHYLEMILRETMIEEQKITQLEKRARGFRRIISSLNDLPMYGINPTIDKMLYVKIQDLKDHLKKKIQRNNERLNEIYTESVDSLIDDDGSAQPIKKW